MKKFVVIGGGTSGWITALYLKHVLPYHSVTLIESKDIGILGAGEGSTPTLINFLDFVNIPVSDLIKNCDATIKNGIKFTNWNNDGDFYYHPFAVNNDLGFDGIQIGKMGLSSFSSIASNIYFNENIKDIDFTSKISELNKVPFVINNTENNINPIFNYSQLSKFSIHFNASKLANRLKEIGLSREIVLLQKTITDIHLDENQNIKYLDLEDNTKIECDFVFDCSGFNKLISQKAFKSNWKSYSEYLPVDSALPFFLEIDNNIPAYTESIAMKYGWMWKIPLQSRYGCGYVYDSSLISEQEAAKEIEAYLGFEPEYPRKNKGSFKFNAGYYEEPWKNNCISVGLSAGFIEPLEATSIWTIILSLEKILSNSQNLFTDNQKNRDAFNEYFRDINSQIADFIYFHYMSDRNDTEFWKKFSYDNAPKTVKEIIDKWNNSVPEVFELNGNLFSTLGWLLISNGTKQLNKDVFNLLNEHSDVQKYALNFYHEFKEKQNAAVPLCVQHKDFLESLK